MSVPSAVFAVAFEQLNDFFQHIKVQSNKKKNRHHPDDGNVKEQSIEIHACKMFCRLVQVCGKIKKTRRPVFVDIDGKNFLD